jgi:tRNA(Ile2)-agmatinylcytidine synthase
MLLAVDDTDGKNGGCTTYVITRIISEIGIDLIGFPRLVRLNPNIPYKTRGNAALAAVFGKGIGTRIKIGEFGKKPIYSYENYEDIPDYEEYIDKAWKIVLENADTRDQKTNPGMIAVNHKPDESIYLETVRKVRTIESAMHYLRENGIPFRFEKNGRGLIGALAAASWNPERITYETIFYKYPHPDRIDKKLSLEIAGEIDRLPGTFNNIDPENRHAAIFPSPETPVMMGIRSLNTDPIDRIHEIVSSRYSMQYDGFITFQTNQATDEHYISNPREIEDMCSYSIMVRVEDRPKKIHGGHGFFTCGYNGMHYSVAVFEPSKGMRSVLDDIFPGDVINLYASFKNGTFNAEKIIVTSYARLFVRRNPKCEVCGRTSRNTGSGRFKCISCGWTQKYPQYDEIVRNRPLSYEAPVASRRHLVAPLESHMEMKL